MLLNSNIFTSDAAHSTFVMLKVMANLKIKTKAQRFLVAKDPGALFPESPLTPGKKGPWPRQSHQRASSDALLATPLTGDKQMSPQSQDHTLVQCPHPSPSERVP